MSNNPPGDGDYVEDVTSQLDEHGEVSESDHGNLSYDESPYETPAPAARGGFLEPDVLSTSIAPIPEPSAIGAPSPFVSRSRIYGFVLDQSGMPIEFGSGRFAKAYLGEERWVESKTAFRRHVAIKCMQSGVSPEDQMRFQMEKEILERVQGHPNIIEVIASGESDNPHFIPPMLRDRVENDYMILELARHVARGAPQRLAHQATPRRPAGGDHARAHLSRARLRHAGRDRHRVRAPGPRHRATAISSRPTS